MTIVQAYNYFIQTLVDKYGDTSIEDFEFTSLFNRAQLAVLKDHFNNKSKRGQGGILPYAFEMSQTDLHRWMELIQEVEVTTAATGRVTWAAINAALGADRYVFHINTPLVKVGDVYKKARYVRHNDYAEHIGNNFLKPRENKPIWRGFEGYLQIDPAGAKDLKLTVTRYPKTVVLDFTTPGNNVDPDISDNAVMDVLARMEQYYGIQIREIQLQEGASAQELKQ